MSLPAQHWNPRVAEVLCIILTFLWIIAAAFYQTCQSLAWLWQLVTGGAQ